MSTLNKECQSKLKDILLCRNETTPTVLYDAEEDTLKMGLPHLGINSAVSLHDIQRALKEGLEAQEKLDKVRRVLGVMLSQGTIDKETVEMGLGFKVQVEVV